MRRRFESIIFIAITFLSLGLTHLYVTFYSPASRQGTMKLIYIPRGTSFRMIAQDLEKAGIVRDSDSFIFAASLFGAYKKVKAGEYEFLSSMPPIEILDMLVKGRVKNYSVTIPEGYNIYEVADAVAATNLVTREAFLSKVTDKKFVASLGFEGHSLEGYLYPDTYYFSKGMTPEEMVLKMVDRFKSVYNKEFGAAARSRGMTLRSVITLASIIEKETGSAEERGLISAVFLNRLKKGIKLQSDPTVIYGLREFDGNLTKKHLQAKNPYNTYLNYGLPPGPIANPGRSSILAAVNPVDTDYLYFVSKNDGTHYFSKNLLEHNRAVNTYQRHMRISSRAPAKG